MPRVASTVREIVDWEGAFEARVVRWYTYCDTIGLAGDRGGGVVTE